MESDTIRCTENIWFANSLCTIQFGNLLVISRRNELPEHSHWCSVEGKGGLARSFWRNQILCYPCQVWNKLCPTQNSILQTANEEHGEESLWWEPFQSNFFFYFDFVKQLQYYKSIIKFCWLKLTSFMIFKFTHESYFN